MFEIDDQARALHIHAFDGSAVALQSKVMHKLGSKSAQLSQVNIQVRISTIKRVLGSDMYRVPLAGVDAIPESASGELRAQESGRLPEGGNGDLIAAENVEPEKAELGTQTSVSLTDGQ